MSYRSATFVVFVATMIPAIARAQAPIPSETFIDVTNPPDGMEEAIPNDGVDDTTALQAIFNRIKQSGTQAVVYLPPSDGSDGFTGTEGYRIEAKLTVGGAEGITLLGSGRFKGAGEPVDAYTKLTWVGDASGPMISLEDASGLVMRGLSFVGDGTISHLVRHENVAGGSDSVDLHIVDCAFQNSPRLWYNTGTASTGQVLFENCIFRGTLGATIRLSDSGFYNNNPTGVAFTFDQCYFNYCNTCIYLHNGGRLQVYGGGIAICRQFIHREDRAQDVNGVSVRDVYIDGGGVPRMVW